MSVGGDVIEVIGAGDKVWINTSDHGEECAIYVEPTEDAQKIAVGDVLWWQGTSAYWTPRSRIRRDVRIPRIGYSGVRPPRLGVA